MKILFLYLVFLLVANCSLNNDSKYWNEDAINKKENQQRLTKILKKTNDITKMTLDEYEIYIDDYTKKSKYPNISK